MPYDTSFLSSGGKTVDLSGINPAAIYKQGLEVRQGVRNTAASRKFSELAQKFDPNDPNGLASIITEGSKAGLGAEIQEYAKPYIEQQKLKAEAGADTAVSAEKYQTIMQKVNDALETHRAPYAQDALAHPENIDKNQRAYFTSGLAEIKSLPQQFQEDAIYSLSQRTNQIGQPTMGMVNQGQPPQDYGNTAVATATGSAVPVGTPTPGTGSSPDSGMVIPDDAKEALYKLFQGGITIPKNINEAQITKFKNDYRSKLGVLASDKRVKELLDQFSAPSESGQLFDETRNPKTRSDIAKGIVEGTVDIDQAQKWISENPSTWISDIKKADPKADPYKLQAQAEVAKQNRDKQITPNIMSAIDSGKRLIKLSRSLSLNTRFPKVNDFLLWAKHHAGAPETQAYVTEARTFGHSLGQIIPGAGSSLGGLEEGLAQVPKELGDKPLEAAVKELLKAGVDRSRNMLSQGGVYNKNELAQLNELTKANSKQKPLVKTPDKAPDKAADKEKPLGFSTESGLKALLSNRAYDGKTVKLPNGEVRTIRSGKLVK